MKLATTALIWLFFLGAVWIESYLPSQYTEYHPAAIACTIVYLFVFCVGATGYVYRRELDEATTVEEIEETHDTEKG